jgi:two-component system chemotaxis sensor kinase CheA
MNDLVSKLHDVESELSTMINDTNNTNEKLIELITNNTFEEWLNKDINIIKEILGDELFEIKGKVTVKEETLSQIEDKIVKLALKHDELETYEPVVNEIKSLKYKTLYTLLSSYPKLLDQLSQKLDKSIYPLDIIVDKTLKVEDGFKPFIKTLVHVFRNAIDHGIESMDERAEIGKDEVGTITCTAKQVDKNLYITIADDGRGLNKDKIIAKAQQLSIDTNGMDDMQIYSLIFSDGFSTKEEISEISGRGVGMAAVKFECDKLNGLIKINSQKDVGTTIEFIIPL